MGRNICFLPAAYQPLFAINADNDPGAFERFYIGISQTSITTEQEKFQFSRKCTYVVRHSAQAKEFISSYSVSMTEFGNINKNGKAWELSSAGYSNPNALILL